MTIENYLGVLRKALLVERVRQKKGKWLVLAALFLVCAIGFGEGFSAEPRQVRIESNTSSLDGRKCCDKSVANVLGPVAGGRVDTGQGGKNRSAEGVASDTTASAVLAPKLEPMISKNAEQTSDEGYKCDEDCSLYLTLPLWLLFYWIAFKPPKAIVEHNAHAQAQHMPNEARRATSPGACC